MTRIAYARIIPTLNTEEPYKFLDFFTIIAYLKVHGMPPMISL